MPVRAQVDPTAPPPRAHVRLLLTSLRPMGSRAPPTTEAPPDALPQRRMHVRSFNSQPCFDAHFSTARCPPEAARVRDRECCPFHSLLLMRSQQSCADPMGGFRSKLYAHPLRRTTHGATRAGHSSAASTQQRWKPEPASGTLVKAPAVARTAAGARERGAQALSRWMGAKAGTQCCIQYLVGPTTAPPRC